MGAGEDSQTKGHGTEAASQQTLLGDLPRGPKHLSYVRPPLPDTPGSDLRPPSRKAALVGTPVTEVLPAPSLQPSPDSSFPPIPSPSLGAPCTDVQTPLPGNAAAYFMPNSL